MNKTRILAGIIIIGMLIGLVLPLTWASSASANSINFQATVVKSDFSGWANVNVEVWNGNILLATGNTNSAGDVFFSLPVGGPYEFRAGNASTTASVVSVPDAALVGVILMPTVVADFSANPNPACVGNNVQFTDQSSDNLTSWNWSFGDGDTSTEQNPTHAYTNPATYTVSLTANNDCGEDTETKDNYITVVASCQATAPPLSVCQDTTVNDDLFTSHGAQCSENCTTSLIYSFDGSQSGQYPYTISCSNGTCSDNATGTVTVVAPCTSTAPSFSICQGATVNKDLFTTKGASCSENCTMTLTYNFDGNTPGAYDYTVTCSNGTCSDNATGHATINQPPTANAGPDKTITSGGSTVIGGSPTASGGSGNYTYSWIPVADLNNSALANPTASPAATTIYTVTATDNATTCTASDNMTLTVTPPPPPPPPGGGGGGGDGGAIAISPCPLSLTGEMLGTIAETTMTMDGVLCETLFCTAAGHSLRLEKGTKVMLAGNVVPRLIRFSQASVTPPTPENTVIVGPVYEINAYASTYGATPSPITISPPALLIVTYAPDKLPKNTSELFIANYDIEQGWLALAPVPGVVAEVDKAYGLLSHTTPFAVLAKLAAPAPAKFEASNLTVSPSQAQLNQEVAISLNVTNTGGTSGSYSLELKVNGISKSTKQVTVTAGTSQTVNFTITGDAVGKHQVEVAGLAGEFEIVKTAKQSQINWWLIGGITGIILLIIIGLIVRRRQLRGY